MLPGDDKAALGSACLVSDYAGGFVSTGLLGLVYASGGRNSCVCTFALVLAAMGSIAALMWGGRTAPASRTIAPDSNALGHKPV